MYSLKGSEGLAGLEHWDLICSLNEGEPQVVNTFGLNPAGVGGWEFASCPPGVKEVKLWITSEKGKSHDKFQSFSLRSQVSSLVHQRPYFSISIFHIQIKGPTQENPYGLEHTLGAKTSDASRARQAMTSLSLEIFGICLISVGQPTLIYL